MGRFQTFVHHSWAVHYHSLLVLLILALHVHHYARKIYTYLHYHLGTSSALSVLENVLIL